MRSHSRRLSSIALSVAMLAALPASAEEILLRGWGPRFGLADDPDQVVFGAHFDLGEFVDRVRFVPNIEIGVGDDHTVLALTAPVHYRWEGLPETDIVPFAGGGVTVGLTDRDDVRGRNDDDTDVDLALKILGGAEWPLKRGNSFFIEINLVLGDVHDVQALAGWTFRR